MREELNNLYETINEFMAPPSPTSQGPVSEEKSPSTKTVRRDRYREPIEDEEKDKPFEPLTWSR